MKWRRAAGACALVLLAIVCGITAGSAYAATPPVNTVAPSLTGTAQDGKTLTLNRGTWTGTATITYTYQWQQSSDGGSSWSDISGATSTTYTPPAGFAGKQVRGNVTATNSAGSGQASSPASAVILAGPPVNTVAPSLSGTAQDGKVLTVAKGTWTGGATITYTYQWQQSSDGGSSWSDISGATSTTYTPPAGFAGKQVRANVIAANADGTSQASSPASAVILAAPPVNTVAPSLSGTAQDGKALTVAKGTWTGVATITYAYQWQVSTDGGSTWSDISGATSTTYTPPAGSAGKQVRANVTATNGDGNSQAASPASAVIIANPPVNTIAPSLSGTAKDGLALTAVVGTWTGMATITYTYRWQVSTDGGSTWSDISGATSSSYTPPAGSAGKQVRVLVTGTNGDGSLQVPSPASAVILAAPPVNTVAPSLSGTAQDGKALTVAKGTWTGVATITYAYQWEVSTDGGSTWSPISGATGTSYTPPAGSAGKQVRARVTATNGDGTSQAFTTASAVILSNPPVNTVAPSLSGTAQDGQTLTANRGTWTGMATITYAYQWQVSTDGGASWSNIGGATGTSYTPPAGSAGKQVRVLVTGTNGDGSLQVPSPASAVILAAPPVNTVSPSLSGLAQDGKTLTAGKGTWTGVATITYTYQWQVSTDGGSSWADISGATSSTFTPPAGYAGKQVRVVVTATNPDGSGQAMSPASAVILADPPVNTVAPTASGIAQDGSPLTGATGTWTGLATITYAYQWQVSTDGGSTWSDIAGETGTSFTPPAGYAGKQVRVVVTGTNGDGSTQASSAATAAILASPPANTTLPGIAGTAQDGHALSADAGLWSGPPTIVYGYQWQVSNDGGATWSDISGATSTSFTPPAGFAGKQVRILVTATNADGSTQAVSSPTAAILANPPTNTMIPSLTGSGETRQPLNTDNGAWSGLATITFTYQWQVSHDAGLTWTNIAGATGSSYSPLGRYAGDRIRVVVAATNGDGSSQAASASMLVRYPVSSGSPAAPTPRPTPPAAPAPALPAPTPPAEGSHQPITRTPRPSPKPKPKPKAKPKAKPKHSKPKSKPKAKPKRPRHSGSWTTAPR